MWKGVLDFSTSIQGESLDGQCHVCVREGLKSSIIPYLPLCVFVLHATMFSQMMSKLTILGTDILHGTTTTQFSCTNCNALYYLIKVEAGPETVDRDLNCQACGAKLPARDGQFVLKYFLLWNPRRR
jgi:hypothetical protein